MFIFLRLLLAHFIADFPLQLSGVYRLKLEKVWGSFVHSAVVALICAIMCMPFLKYPEMWVIIFWVWIIHGLQDWIKVAYCEKARKDNLWIFMLDQLLHIALISVVFLVPKLGSITGPVGDGAPILRLYNDNAAVVYAMGYIFSGFGGVFMNLYMKESFLKLRSQDIPSGREKWYGILERILITTVVVLGDYWLLAILLLWGARLGLAKASGKKVMGDLAINTIVAVAIGLAVVCFTCYVVMR